MRLDGLRDVVLSFWPKTRCFFALFQNPIIVHQILSIDAMLYEVSLLLRFSSQTHIVAFY